MNKAWSLPVEPIGSYRELCALNVADTLRPEDTLTDALARFYRKFKCPACGLHDACTHRQRVDDVRLIMGFVREPGK